MEKPTDPDSYGNFITFDVIANDALELIRIFSFHLSLHGAQSNYLHL